uniref:Integrase core domain containing protein n=1 Tax=Solanum tuberosum TaxID=4113 RepID=M1D9V9_SOLTU
MHHRIGRRARPNPPFDSRHLQNGVCKTRQAQETIWRIADQVGDPDVDHRLDLHINWRVCKTRRGFADMTRSKAAERIIPAQEKTKGFTINEDATISRGKSTKLPITGGKGKGKRSTSDRKTTIRDPNVPLWGRGLCSAVHVFLEDSHVTSPSGSGTAVPSKVTPSTDAQTQSDVSGTDAQTYGTTV